MLAVDEHLQRHALIESQLSAQREWLQNIGQQAATYVKAKGEKYEVLQAKCAQLNETFEK